MKLDLILENTRNRYSLGLLEESEGMSEKDLLKGKILINESTMAVRRMLVEEGVMAQVQANLEEAWTAQIIQEDLDGIEGAYDSAKEYLAPGVKAVQGAANTVATMAAPYVDQGINAGQQGVAQAIDTGVEAAQKFGIDTLSGNTNNAEAATGLVTPGLVAGGLAAGGLVAGGLAAMAPKPTMNRLAGGSRAALAPKHTIHRLVDIVRR